MAFGSPPHMRGLMVLIFVGWHARVGAEGFGANGGENIRREPRQLLVETAAIDVAQLREHRECGLTCDEAERQLPRIGTRTGGERQRQKGIFIVLAQHDDWAREAGTLAIDLIADVDAQMRPPDFALAKEQRLDIGVEKFLLLVPTVEIFAGVAGIHKCANL